MTKKCLISFLIFSAFSAIMLIAMHLMLLADVNKFVGVGIGAGIMWIDAMLAIIFRKNIIYRFIPFVNAVGCGLAISSLYVYLDRAPQVWHSVVVWSAFSAVFAIYCFVVNVDAIKYHPVISIIFCFLVVLVPTIVCTSLCDKVPFLLALFTFIPFAAFLVTTAAKAKDVNEQLFHIMLMSFAALIIVIIVVLLIISQGEVADGVDITPDIGGPIKKRRSNPYEYISHNDFIP